MHCMPCSSRIISETIPQICYHSNYGISNWCALVPLQNVILFTSPRHRHQNDVIVGAEDIYATIGIGAWQTLYAMLR